MSGRKNSLKKFQCIVAGDMSQAEITSAVTNTAGLDNIGIQLVWTGDAIGTFAIEVSIDYAQDYLGNVTNAGTWQAITLSTPVTAAGADDNAYIDITQISAPWIRTTYTKTSGTGTLNGWVAGKMI